MDDLGAPLDPDDNLFSFESDHLALKGNVDYCDVLKTLVVLNAQREQALKDFKAVAELQTEILKDPITLAESIKNGSINIPAMQSIVKLPMIDIKKYNIKVVESDLDEIYSDGSEAIKRLEQRDVINPNPTNWTTEEQRKLEELLQIHPPEAVEVNRYKKIAKALGNRTTQQVASRIQKYFLKLYKAGLPVPGRIPRAAEKYKRSSVHKHQRNNHLLYKPTTFFPEWTVPVKMDLDSNVPGPSEGPHHTTTNYLLRNQDNSEEYQLELLKRVRAIKQLDISTIHLDIQCNYCDETPIVGARWHCTVCSESIDFCTDCVVAQMYSETSHPVQHWLEVCQDGFDRLIDEEINQVDSD